LDLVAPRNEGSERVKMRSEQQKKTAAYFQAAVLFML